MSSRDRILNTLNRGKRDRVAIYDIIDKETCDKWKLGKAAHDYFSYDLAEFDFKYKFFEDIDLETFLSKKSALRPQKSFLYEGSFKNSLVKDFSYFKDKEKFLCLSIVDPFEYLAETIGLEDLLLHMASSSDKVITAFGSINQFFIGMLETALCDFRLDGVWIWSDLCYNKGSYFSKGTYRKLLRPFHEELLDFCHKKNLPVFFHCDGSIKDILGEFVDLGVRVVHPVEESCNDISVLKKEFGKDVTFFGNISVDILRQNYKIISQRLSAKFDILKDAGYIYCLDSSIPKDMELEKYEFLLNLVRNYK